MIGIIALCIIVFVVGVAIGAYLVINTDKRLRP